MHRTDDSGLSAWGQLKSNRISPDINNSSVTDNGSNLHITCNDEEYNITDQALLSGIKYS